MSPIRILLMSGGGSTEHDISLVSSKYILENLQIFKNFEVYDVVITKEGKRQTRDGKNVEIRFPKLLVIENQSPIQIDFAVPCFHGYPGETGDIQSVYEMMKLPYLGSGSESSKLCFNKISTKLWMNALGIPNTPFIFLADNNSKTKAEAKSFLAQHKEVFVKASNQGSSVGCYPVNSEKELDEAILKAFEYSPYVLIEKKIIKGRELEVSVYEYQNNIHTPPPGEVIAHHGFYSYDEKYSSQSKTETVLVASGLSLEISNRICEYAAKAFKGLKLRHLARIDFFLTQNQEIYLNEINSFPGMTPISMFPKMMENHGHKFSDFLQYSINKTLESKLQ